MIQTLKNYSWPIGIVVALALFMGMTLVYVKRAFSERVDLVAPDYYYRDKAFSDRLEREKALNKFGQSAITRSDQGVTVSLPAYFAKKHVKGSVLFYSPLNPADDFTRALEFDGQNQSVKADLKGQAVWKVSFDFEVDGTKYYLQSALK